MPATKAKGTTRRKVRPVPIYDKQAQFRTSTAWIRGFVAGRGSGKTRIGALDILLRARDGEPWMAVSPSIPVVEETTYPTFKEVAEQIGVFVRGTKSPLPRIVFRTQDGGLAECVFRSAEKPDSLRGPSKAGIWFDEASVMHHDAFKYGTPVLRYKGRMGKCLMTFTPRGKRHWTFETFYERVDDIKQVELESRKLTALETRLYTKMGAFWYKLRPNTHLIHARTSENPFLPAEFEDLIAAQYSSLLQAQELGGQFIDAGGLLFRRENFRAVDRAPRDCMRARYWDRAATPDGGDYSAGVLMAFDGRGRFYIEDVVHGQWSWQERNTVMMQTAERDAMLYSNEVTIFVEQEGGSGGKEAAEQAVIMLAGYPVYRDVVSGQRHRKKDNERLPGEAKIVRAQPFAAQAEAGNVHYIAGARWVETLFDELSAFPEARHDDIVDACSGAFNKLATKVTLDIGGASRPERKVDSPIERPEQSTISSEPVKHKQHRTRRRKKS